MNPLDHLALMYFVSGSVPTFILAAVFAKKGRLSLSDAVLSALFWPIPLLVFSCTYLGSLWNKYILER